MNKFWFCHFASKVQTVSLIEVSILGIAHSQITNQSLNIIGTMCINELRTWSNELQIMFLINQNQNLK
jgi:hypothetical protein